MSMDTRETSLSQYILVTSWETEHYNNLYFISDKYSSLIMVTKPDIYLVKVG